MWLELMVSGIVLHTFGYIVNASHLNGPCLFRSTGPEAALRWTPALRPRYPVCTAADLLQGPLRVEIFFHGFVDCDKMF